MTSLPKIFIFIIDELSDGQVISAACAEDGTMLVSHLSSAKIYVRHDMGLTSRVHHIGYGEYYSGGYNLIDLVDATEEELAANKELQEALDRGIEDTKEQT